MPPVKTSILNIPNYLTFLRILSIPLILIPLQSGRPNTSLWAALIFSVAFFTDWLDGFIARKKNLVTKFGKILDPLADKLLIGCTLIMLIGLDRVEAWMGILLIGREIAVTWLRSTLAGRGNILASSWWGKYKTFFQAIALIFLMIHYPYFSIDFHFFGTFLLLIALTLTIWSGLLYSIQYYSILMNKSINLEVFKDKGVFSRKILVPSSIIGLLLGLTVLFTSGLINIFSSLVVLVGTSFFFPRGISWGMTKFLYLLHAAFWGALARFLLQIIFP
jgi:CDP-diacylglycerol---glycerol-3-phosphate 3-phosphatidyltransferase